MEMESSLSSMTFKGPVTQAIAEAKHQKKLLLVYVSGDDADTSSLERYTLRSLNVVQFVLQYCIFLHLPAESADGLQFTAMYNETNTEPQKSIPSMTVVGFKGVKLWQHAGYIDPEALASSLGKLLNLRIQETTETVETTSLASKSFEVATNSTPGTSTSTSFESKPSSGPTLSSDHPSPSHVLDLHSAPISVEDKMEDESKMVTRVDKLNDVHLSIRLVNGCSLQEKFPLTSSLQMVKEYVDSNQGADSGSYNLAIPCPLKVFNDRELSKSLSELGLFHRQALIVVACQRPGCDGKRGFFYLKRANSKKTDVSAQNGGGYSAFVKWILSYANPLAYLGGAASSSSNSEQESQIRTREHGPTANRQRSISDPSSGGRSGQAPSTSGLGSNIHTLDNYKDDDGRPGNRNTFWNGNSTVYGGDNGEAK